MTKPKPDKIVDLPVLLAFPDSTTGEAVIAELTQRLRDSESALAAHKRRHCDAAVQGFEMFSKHLIEAEKFEHASAHISVVLERARKRLLEVQQAERREAGEKARSEALALADECGSLLNELLAETKDITTKLARWNARSEEVERLNGIASAGGSDVVAMPQLSDDAEAAAEAGAEAAQALGKFLTNHSRAVYVRKQRALRLAEAEAKKRAEAPTEEEAASLRDKGFDPDILSREPRDADEGYRKVLIHQAINAMRGLSRGAPAVTSRLC